MRVSRYEFAEGARFQPGALKDADPNAVGRHIEFLRQEQKGELTPTDVVSDARNPNSPLHRFFEWDDDAAAEQHRLAQARGLIRAVVAIYVDEEKPATRQRAFVHIRESGANHYRATGEALARKPTREHVLQRAWEELQQWRRRYRDLEEFSHLIDAIDEVGEKIPSAARR